MELETTELTLIEKSKAEQIKETFEPMVKMLSGFDDEYNKLIEESEKDITKSVTTKAKRLRLDMARVRIDTDKLRKSQKEEYLRAGKAIDGVSNILKWAISEKEEKLSGIEKHFEILEAKKKVELQKKRVLEIESYVSDSDDKDYSAMEDDVWSAYLQAKKKDYLDYIEAEKKAELEKEEAEKKEALERERIKSENEKLKKEVEAQKAKESERLKVESEKNANLEAKEKVEREAREKIEAEELKKRTELENKLKEKEAEELRLKNEAEAKIQSDLNKGDKDKVLDLMADLEILKTKYSFKSVKNKKTYSTVISIIENALNELTKGNK